MEKISVIVPTYGRSTSLERAINSVLNQTYENFEVIVIDDNGIESTGNILTRKVMGKFSNHEKVKYIQLQKNSGGSIARNAGIEKAEGKYITFLDDDDEYYKTKLEKQIIFYKKTFPQNDGFINCQIKVFRENKFIRDTKTKVDYQNLLFSAVSEKILGTPTLFIPKQLLNSVGMFTDRTKGQEWDLVVKLVAKGYKFRSMDDKLVRVNVSQNSITSDSNIDRRINGLKEVYLKQSSYFGHFSKKQVDEIKNSHYIKLSETLLFLNFYDSLKCYFTGLKYRLFFIGNLKYPIKALRKITGI